MTRIDLSLPDAMREWVESRIESGLYADADDYIRDLIRHDQKSAASDHVWAAELHGMIAEGLADLDAGRVHDIEEVFREAHAAIDEVERRKQHAQ